MTKPRSRKEALAPLMRFKAVSKPAEREKNGIAIGSGRTMWGALRSRRLRSRVDSAVSRNSPFSR